MRALLSFLLATLLAFPVVALKNGQVLYVGGTASGLREGTLGMLDTTSPTALTFQFPGGVLVIPYAQIVSYEYSEPVARHLGVLPAVAVGLLVHRQHRHIFRLTHHGANGSSEVVILEVPKQMSRALLAILQARAPQPCRPQPRCANPALPPVAFPD